MVKTNRTETTNPFYERVMAEGIRLVGKAAASERSKTANQHRSNKRSRKMTEKSVWLPETVWERVEAQARREGKTLDAAFRQAALIWLRS